MKNQKKIMEEIEAIGLRIKEDGSGYLVYPKERDEYLIFKVELDKLIGIACKYNLRYYINFELGYVRVH